MKSGVRIIGTSLRSSPLLAFGFFVFVIFAAYQTARYIVNDDIPGLAYVAMAFVAGRLP